MTVEASNALNEFVSDGVRRLYTYDFRILEDDDLFVFVNGVLTTDYIIQNKTNISGQIVFNTAPADLATIAISRRTDITQEVDFFAFAPFAAQNNELIHDKPTMILQEAISGGRGNVARGARNLAVSRTIEDVTVINDRGEDAVIPVWSGVDDLAGMSAGEVGPAPVNGLATTELPGYIWYEPGSGSPPVPPIPLNCNFIETVAVLTPTLHIAGEVAGVFDGDLIIGTGPLFDDRTDIIDLPNNADNYTSHPGPNPGVDTGIGQVFFPACQFYNYCGPSFVGHMSGPTPDLRVNTGQWTHIGTGTVTFDQTGILGDPNEASLVTDTGTDDTFRIQKETAFGGFGIDTDPFWGKLIILKEVSAVQNSRFTLQNAAGTQEFMHIKFNAQTGAATLLPGGGGLNPAFEVRDYGDWWEVALQVDKNASVSNDGRFIIEPAFNADGSEVRDDTITGSITVGEANIYEEPPAGGPSALEIKHSRGGAVDVRLGATGAVIDISNINLPASNHSDTQGGYYMEWRPLYSRSEITRDVEILSLNDDIGLLFYDFSTERLTATDGTNTATVSLTLVAERKYRLGVIFGSASLQVGVDGVFGASVGGGLFDILRNPEAVNYWRELRGYQDTFANTKTEITLLMAG